MDYISHYGVKGMHWGIRRYQNLDGTYTIEGKQALRNKRYVKNIKDKETVDSSLSKKQREWLGSPENYDAS